MDLTLTERAYMGATSLRGFIRRFIWLYTIVALVVWLALFVACLTRVVSWTTGSVWCDIIAALNILMFFATPLLNFVVRRLERRLGFKREN